MYILGIRADKLTSSDINRLINNQIQESKTLDYKKELNLSKDKDKKEFLFDVSAMYNTEGGCIIYGIEELKDDKNQNTGKPNKVSGIDIENSDKLIQQIEDIVKNSTEPSISQLLIKEIDVGGLNVMVLGIPKGLGLPAMVTFSQTNKFYKRRNSGKFPVDVYELNQMFMQNQVLFDKAKNLRKNRISEVLLKENIPNLVGDTIFLIHIIPYSFLENSISDFAVEKNDLTKQMKPLLSQSTGWNLMYNLDGFATFATTYQMREITSYNQLFRNGVYEIYTSELFYGTRHQKEGFDDEVFMRKTVECIKQGLDVLNKMKIESPFFVSFSFHNVKGKIMDNNRATFVREFTKNDLLFPLIQIPAYESDIMNKMKPSFDILWQSFGYAKSPNT